jgi:hypothetical protein
VAEHVDAGHGYDTCTVRAHLDVFIGDDLVILRTSAIGT